MSSIDVLDGLAMELQGRHCHGSQQAWVRERIKSIRLIRFRFDRVSSLLLALFILSSLCTAALALLWCDERSPGPNQSLPIGLAEPGSDKNIEGIITDPALTGDQEIEELTEPTIDASQQEFFESKIRPVLVAECYSCHSVEAENNSKLRGALLLDSRDATLAGGESGPAVVPGSPDESLLISALKHEGYEMPPKGKLDDAVIADFVKWVEMGAPDPRDAVERAATKPFDIEARRSFWSFQRLSDAEPPKLDAFVAATNVPSEFLSQPIDRFVVAKQLEKNLSPSALASPRVLIRRAWFDLLGLPPTPEQMNHWLARLTKANLAGAESIDQAAWAELIRYLLEQPQYGERWARHWIDVARFAESHGYEQDYDRPTAYHYRDFLIKAFNQDLPYDKFVQWQLAGDELAPDDPLAWMATGFLGGGAFPTQLTEAEFESARYDELDDMVGTTGVAFLGLSIACARCHDHKFDPISSRDYYRMAATFTTAIRTEKTFDLEPEENRKRQEAYDARLAEARKQLEAYDRDTYATDLVAYLLGTQSASGAVDGWRLLDGKLTSQQKTEFNRRDASAFTSSDQADLELLKPLYTKHLATRSKLAKELSDLEAKGPEIKLTKVLVTSEGLPHLPHHADDRGFPHFYPETSLLRRGDVNQKVEVVQPGALQVLLPLEQELTPWECDPSQRVNDKTSYRRSTLARWMTDPNQGAGHLAARVMVNRIWQHHFGRGLVATPSDFGSSGDHPTHPELLDWLAKQLISSGWSLKQIHQMIMCSHTYMQGDKSFDDPRTAIDVANQFYWHRSPLRLEAEAIRDAMLSASGQLDSRMYGPGTMDRNMRRRSVYFFIKRSQLIPEMMLFDWPEHLVSIGQRPSTTIAPQALMFINSPQGRSYAEGLAKRVNSPDAAAAISKAFDLTLNREPTDDELTVLTQFLNAQTTLRKQQNEADADAQAMTDMCQMILSMNEFIYVD